MRQLIVNARDPCGTNGNPVDIVDSAFFLKRQSGRTGCYARGEACSHGIYDRGRAVRSCAEAKSVRFRCGGETSVRRNTVHAGRSNKGVAERRSEASYTRGNVLRISTCSSSTGCHVLVWIEVAFCKYGTRAAGRLPGWACV